MASLVRQFGDIDLAEEAIQEAFAVAVAKWPITGLPPSPAGWIITTGRNRAIDWLRREASRKDRRAQAMALTVPADGREPEVTAPGGGPGAGRPSAADLHLLPSGAGPGHPGRADVAVTRRADHP